MTQKYQGRVLWFDVGIKRYTTVRKGTFLSSTLWFDVGIKRYTTFEPHFFRLPGCGLM